MTAHDQTLVQAQFGVETVDRRSLRAVLGALAASDALVLGGGSLLQDSTSFRSLLYYAALILAARFRRRPVLLWGQGLGPLRRRRSRILARTLLPLATGITWRDRSSFEQGRRWGLSAGLGSDPVWSLTPLAWQGRGGPIVLCWRPVRRLDGAAWRRYLASVEALALQAEREVLWLPFHRDQDGSLFEELDSQGLMSAGLRARSRPIRVLTPLEAMDQFSRAGITIAMRLHGLILAALAGSPCAALSYDPKVAAAAEGIGCPCHDLETPPSPALSDGWRQVVDRPPDPGRIETLRRQAGVHAELFSHLSTPLRRASAAPGSGDLAP